MPVDIFLICYIEKKNKTRKKYYFREELIIFDWIIAEG